jgi:hypothetical protein
MADHFSHSVHIFSQKLFDQFIPFSQDTYRTIVERPNRFLIPQHLIECTGLFRRCTGPMKQHNVSGRSRFGFINH